MTAGAADDVRYSLIFNKEYNRSNIHFGHLSFKLHVISG
jgi:hypothetical protein